MEEFVDNDSSSNKKDKVKFTAENLVPDEFFTHVEQLLKSNVFESQSVYWHDSVKYRLGIFAGDLTPESKNWGSTYPISQLEKWFFKPSYLKGNHCATRLAELCKKYGVDQFTWLDTGPWNLISIRTPKLAITFIDSPFRVSNVQLERDALLGDVPKGTTEQTTAQAVEQWKKKRGF